MGASVLAAVLVLSGVVRAENPYQVMKAQLLAYAASDRFAPKASISPEQLVAVIDAPIVTGSADTNRANDTNANRGGL